MHRPLIVGVAACLLLFVAPGPSEAAGVTRTAPFDFGTQCVTQDAHGAALIVGTPIPSQCWVVPDPAAYLGRLSTRQEAATGTLGVVADGWNQGGATGGATVGRAWSATGLNSNSGPGGRILVTLQLSGASPGAFVCLSIGMQSLPAQVTNCGTNPAASTELAPGVNYTIMVKLMDGNRSVANLPGPCPPGVIVTCTLGAAATASGVQMTVDAITYSFS
jgi:hypothetical protein